MVIALLEQACRPALRGSPSCPQAAISSLPLLSRTVHTYLQYTWQYHVVAMLLHVKSSTLVVLPLAVSMLFKRVSVPGVRQECLQACDAAAINAPILDQVGPAHANTHVVILATEIKCNYMHTLCPQASQSCCQSCLNVTCMLANGGLSAQAARESLEYRCDQHLNFCTVSRREG
jgi:hypothetical protein